MTGINIIGVQFRRAGKIYDFNGKRFLLNQGDKVVVETERGPSLAEVMRVGYKVLEEKDQNKLKPVLRIASTKDLSSKSKITEDDAKSFIDEKIRGLDLDMNIIGVDIQLGGNKTIIFFTAPGRVDFRELVKELAAGLKTRVELKQVGARDEAKQVGGLGICGREFCCSSFLREFVPVSIKMAKNQNLALNPSKVSGGCGRLLCCLTYEDDAYKDLRKKLPPRKARVRTINGELGQVVKADILNQWVILETEQGEQLKYPVTDIEVLDQSQSHNSGTDSDSNDSDDWGEDLDLSQLMKEESRPIENSEGQESTDKKRRNRRRPRHRKGPPATDQAGKPRKP